MPDQSHRILYRSFLVMLLVPGVMLFAQESEDTTAIGSEAFLLEQVYEHRISLLQDSLFLTHEQLDAANFLVRQLEQRADALADSLAFARDQLPQLADSLSRLFIRYDRAVTENQQNLARLGALGDSIALSFQRQNELRALNDSLLIILARTQVYLSTISGDKRAYSDTVAVLRETLEALQEELTAGERRVSGMYDQLKLALTSPGDAEIDSAADERQISYLQQVVEYELEAGRLARLFQRKGKGETIHTYQLDEIHQYLALVALQGHTPEALNLLAGTYVKQEDAIRGALAYLKTLFLYPESEEALQAMSQLEELVERDGELARLYYEVALNPDSVDVSEEEFYRFLNYLNHIRRLSNATAKDWFIKEAEQFLAMYPGILQADKVLLWIAQAYHAREQYHSELLTYLKIRTLYPFSSYLPEVTFAMAEVTADDLKAHETGAERYARFREEFPTHEEAPAALFAEADIYAETLKDYRQAGILYRELADTYPENGLAPISLFRYADLLHNRLASPTGALGVYEEILSKYGAEPETGIPALEGLALISREMRQYDAAVVYYLDIQARYPGEQERAVTGIIEAADIYESQLKNIDATIHTLHMVLDNYPEYPGIRSLQRRIQKLQKRRG